MKNVICLFYFLILCRIGYCDQILNFSDLKLLSQDTTAQDVYLETYNLSPNFGVNDYDDGLKASVQEYFGKNIQIDHIFSYDASTDFHFPKYVTWINKEPSFEDIAEALRKGDPVLTQVDWWSSAPNHTNPHKAGGHYFPIFGFARQNYFGDNLLQLDITDPAPTSPWVVNSHNSDFNVVTALRNKDNPYIFLDGRGFLGQEKRAFLGQLTIIHIQK